MSDSPALRLMLALHHLCTSASNVCSLANHVAERQQRAESLYNASLESLTSEANRKMRELQEAGQPPSRVLEELSSIHEFLSTRPQLNLPPQYLKHLSDEVNRCVELCDRVMAALRDGGAALLDSERVPGSKRRATEIGLEIRRLSDVLRGLLPAIQLGAEVQQDAERIAQHSERLAAILDEVSVEAELHAGRAGETRQEVGNGGDHAAKQTRQEERIADTPAGRLPGMENNVQAIDDLVTLDQMAAVVGKSKKTLERSLRHKQIPEPDFRGGGGKAHRWYWSKVRPALMRHFRPDLPERFPGSRIIP